MQYLIFSVIVNITKHSEHSLIDVTKNLISEYDTKLIKIGE